jgi:peptidoglycan/xylan/chitin deacetylase (PgdA/CDA1 family)
MMENTRLMIARSVQEIPLELARFYRRQYPGFVLDKDPPPLRGEIPVFMFHRVEAETFEEQLDFLKRNGYRSLSLRSFYDLLRGRMRWKGPAVLLTFDDGEKSLYQTAYPLLQKYGFRAAAFVIPHFVPAEPDPRPGKGMVSWAELEEMQRSGLVEVQPHSYRHDLIFSSPRLVDFFNPLSDPNPLGIDRAWVDEDGQYTNQLAWGTPLYTTTGRYSDRPRFLDDPSLRRACSDWAAMHGGEDFFCRPGWRRELRGLFNHVRRKQRPARYESPARQQAAILEDLRRARRAIERRLGQPCQSLCLPRGEGGQLVVRLSQEAGYRSIFWVNLPRRRTNLPGDSPYAICRLKDDYLLRLPGQGRKPLLEILTRKLNRRAATLDLY